MKWKDTAAGEPVENDDEGEDAYPEGAFSALQEKRMGRLLQVALAIGAVAIIALLFFLVPKSDTGAGAEKLAALEAKVQQLAEGVTKYEKLDERFAKIEESTRRLEQFRERFDRMESALTHRLEQLGSRVESLPKKTEAGDAPRPAAAKPAATGEKPATVQAAKPAESAPKAAKPAAAKPKTDRVHVVQPGETLFSIAKAAGLSVNDLRRLNHLAAGASIQPGQKLVLGKEN
jgi:LysM repeat protein